MKQESQKNRLKTRHEKFFGYAIWLVILAAFVLVGFTVQDHFKAKFEAAAPYITSLESARTEGDLREAYEVLSSIEDIDVFETVWDIIDERVPSYEPTLYYALANIYFIQDLREEALFWLFLARFRLSYDAQLCADTEKAGVWRQTFDTQMANADLWRWYQNLPISQQNQMTARQLSRVLAWDEANFKRYVLPLYLCRLTVLPKQISMNDVSVMGDTTSWVPMRQGLRQKTQDQIDLLKANVNETLKDN